MKKILSLLGIIFTLNTFCFSQENKSPFNLNIVEDSILCGTGVTLNTAYFFIDKFGGVKQTSTGTTTFNLDDVPLIDTFFANKYSKSLDTAGDILLLTGMLTPAVLFSTDKNEWLTIGIMYLETVMLTNGIKELTKLAVYRPRPYMYFSDYPEDKVKDGDWCKSFPSGHATMSFAGATFASYVFCMYFPDSPWRFAVTGASYAIATTTLIMRMASGNHFLTDVLTGAVLGTVCGFVVPWMHTFNFDNNSSTKVSLTPAGFNVCIKF